MKPDHSALVAALPAWDWRAPAAVSGALADYARYYRLDQVVPPIMRDAGIRHAIGAADIAGYRIALQSWQRPGARGTVLMLHGYYDHVGLFGHVIGCVLAAGYDLITFDLPGHGLSSGEPATIGEFSEYGAVLRAVIDGMGVAAMPQPWYAVAQSTGGAIFMDYLLANRLDRARAPFAGAVLLAPLVRPAHWPLNSALHALLRPFVDAIARKFSENSHDPEFRRFLREDDPLQCRHLSVRWVSALKRWIPRMRAYAPVDFPLTVVQGDADGTVDWRYNLGVIREKFPAATFHMIPDGRHQLANESPEYRVQVLAHLSRLLA